MRKHYPAMISIGGFGEVLPRKENRVSLDAEVKDAWGIPVLRFDYRFSDNEIKMAKDMADTAEEMLRAAGAESIKIEPRDVAPGLVHPRDRHRPHGRRSEDVGHEPFCRLHDVPNVYFADAAPFVSGGHPEHHVVDPGHVLADHGPPEGADADGRGVGARPPW